MNPLIEAMAARTGYGKKACTTAVVRFSEDIAAVLMHHGECRIPGVGTLKVATRAARKGRNPQTGEAIDIPAKKVVTFRRAKGLVIDD